MEWDSTLSFSVSVTTRPPRPGEVDGKHYHFINHSTFDEMVSSGNMLEYAEVFGNFYGSPRFPVEAAMQAGRDTIFDVDWQGGQQIRASALGAHAVSIFILPPSLAELKRRLISRGQDSADVIAGRMAKSQAEISHWTEYNYILINDNFDTCFASLKAILTAERLRRERQKGLGVFVQTLMKG